ncbi:hypothetical protein NDU88_009282 [Pleurodeles waltl]|uniref:Uncharacterized protein n=1 Tax=Pleurodeles waltl TaxID=8319 RepID=A0AAV7PWU4_PLEWA|nr:hypothetical protein NDU88_009282 [Pleurodeles waltl]
MSPLHSSDFALLLLTLNDRRGVSHTELQSSQRGNIRVKVMNAPDEYQPLKTEATCLICLRLFTEPVITECGHNFCKPCITSSWEVLQGEYPCPQCQKIFSEIRLLPNRQLGNVADIVKEMSLKRKRNAMDNHCRKHKAELKLFCQDDTQPICESCHLSQEHTTHSVISLRKAVSKYKLILEKKKETIKKALDDITKINCRNIKNASELEGQFESQKFMNSFDEMHFIVKMIKMQLCLGMDEDHQLILDSIEEKMEKLEKQQRSLRDYITFLEKKLAVPDVELLRDMKSTLMGCQQLLLRTSEPSAVSLCIQTFRHQQSHMYNIIKEVKETLNEKLYASYLWRQARKFARDITFDLDTAHPLCAFSDDRKSVKVGKTWQDVPNTAERFDKRLCVLGKESFSFGRHYWEVAIGSAKNWDIGVCDASASRKGFFQPTSDNRYWALGLEDGVKHKIFTSPSVTPLFSGQPLRVLGVLLDCEAGNVTFYNVEEPSKLFTIYSRPVPSNFRPYFCTGDKENSLQL